MLALYSVTQKIYLLRFSDFSPVSYGLEFLIKILHPIARSHLR